MVSICLNFHVHQSLYLNQDFSFFDINDNKEYLNHEKAKVNIQRLAKECYLPANEVLSSIIKEHKQNFKISLSFSGLVLELLEKYCPETILSFQELIKTGNVELTGETYYHSLAYFHNIEEFKDQVRLHTQKIKDIFNSVPKTFRNTELIYDNCLAETVESLGYETILTEGANRTLGWRSPNFIYQPKTSNKVKLLLRNFKLSDDLSLKFSIQEGEDFPLTASKYASWIHQIAGNGEVINLFMDYETFGVYHSEKTGIFNFLKQLPNEIFKKEGFVFNTPAEVIQKYQPMAKLDVNNPISWANIERDTSPWVGNDLQDASIDFVYSLNKSIKKAKNKDKLHMWRSLLSSTHFYNMCTKWASDGSDHHHSNQFSTPEDAFIVYNNIVNDLQQQLA